MAACVRDQGYNRAEVGGLESFPPGGAWWWPTTPAGLFAMDFRSPTGLRAIGYDGVYTMSHRRHLHRTDGESSVAPGSSAPATKNATRALRSGGVVVGFPGGDYARRLPSDVPERHRLRRRPDTAGGDQRGVPIRAGGGIGGTESQLYRPRMGLGKALGGKVDAGQDSADLGGLPVGLVRGVRYNVPAAAPDSGGRARTITCSPSRREPDNRRGRTPHRRRMQKPRRAGQGKVASGPSVSPRNGTARSVGTMVRAGSSPPGGLPVLRIIAVARREGLGVTSGFGISAQRCPNRPRWSTKSAPDLPPIDQRADAVAAALQALPGESRKVAIICRNHRGFVASVMRANRIGADVLLSISRSRRYGRRGQPRSADAVSDEGSSRFG